MVCDNEDGLSSGIASFTYKSESIYQNVIYRDVKQALN